MPTATRRSPLPMTEPDAPRASRRFSLWAPLRRRFQRWVHARLTPTDALNLTHRNVYILPTRVGLMFLLTLVILLLASVNYRLNLGYVLTFLLAGSALVSMYSTHSTLRGLTLHLRPAKPVHARSPALLDITLTNPSAARYGISLALGTSPSASQQAWTDVQAKGQAHTQVSFVPVDRGLHELPTLTVETRFPLGLFRAWSVWRPASPLLVYPIPELPSPPLPVDASPSHGSTVAHRRQESGEFDGVRAYRRGDSLKQVVWKKSARNLEAGGDLVSRDALSSSARELMLGWSQTSGLDTEARLSRLTAWVLAAHGADLRYTLALPGELIAADTGDQHRERCLEALALWA